MTPPVDTATAADLFQPVEQPRLYVVIARRIAAHIRDMPLNPGDLLPPERELARQFQVSRTTVREAMIALETMGIIDVRVGDGTYVRSHPGASFPWDRSGDPGPGPHEQFRVRLLAECAAAEDAAANITKAELDELDRLLRAMEADIDGPQAEGQRQAFHAVVANASRNGILADLIRDLWRLRSGEMWRTLSTRGARPEHHVQALNDRKDIYRALKVRDGKAAARAMRRLLDRIRQRYFTGLNE